MKASERFKEVIKDYLDKKAESDKLFAENYKKENKTLDQCVNYIFNTVQASGANGFADEEIFSMAIHYYDEDEITAESELKDMSVIVNHTVELTEEELKEARDAARQKAEDEAYQQMKKKSVKKTKVETTQQSLF